MKGLSRTSDLRSVHWLNRPNHAVDTFGYLSEPSIFDPPSFSEAKWIKSYLAIIVQIPTFEERSNIAALGIEQSPRGMKRKARE